MGLAIGMEDNDPRQIIAEVYRQVHEIRELGREPRRIILHKKQHDLVVWYRNFLGTSDTLIPDYLGDYELFGIPVYAGDELGVILVE